MKKFALISYLGIFVANVYAQANDIPIEIRAICANPSPDCISLPTMEKPGASVLMSKSALITLNKENIRVAQILPGSWGEQLYLQIKHAPIEQLKKKLEEDASLKLAYVIEDQVILSRGFRQPIVDDVLNIEPQNNYGFTRRLPWLKELPESSEKEAMSSKPTSGRLLLGVALVLSAVAAYFFFSKRKT